MGPCFLGRVVIEQHGRRWIVRERLVYVGSRVAPGAHDVPEDFVTDGGSVPRPLWWWVSPLDPQLAPAFLLHDARYERHDVSRQTADALLYEAARARNVRRSKAWCIWLAVRAFGGGAYQSGPWRQRERLQAYRSGLLGQIRSPHIRPPPPDRARHGDAESKASERRTA